MVQNGDLYFILWYRKVYKVRFVRIFMVQKIKCLNYNSEKVIKRGFRLTANRGKSILGVFHLHNASHSTGLYNSFTIREV